MSTRLAIVGTLLILALATLAYWYGPGLFQATSTTLSVVSEPAGASVRIDFAPPIGTTPLDQAAVNPGLQIVAIEADGYAPWDTLLEVRQGHNELHVSLQPGGRQSTEATALLSVFSDPPGASVRFDFGEPAGTTPLHGMAVPPGLQILTIEAEGYVTRDTVLSVDAGEHEIHVALQTAHTTSDNQDDDMPPPAEPSTQSELVYATPGATAATSRPDDAAKIARTPSMEHTATDRAAGTLFVATEPLGGTVFIDGSRHGETPLMLEDMAPGTFIVTVQRDGYAPFTDTVSVEAGVLTKAVGRMEPLRGQLSVLVRPWGSIYIDSTLYRRDTDVEFSTELPVGRHTVHVTHPTMGTWTREVEIAEGAPQRLVVELQPQRASGSDGVLASPLGTSGPDPDSIFDVVDVRAQLVGGQAALYRSVRYPPPALEAGQEGRVYLSYVVDAQGLVHDARVVRGLSRSLDAEALRLLRNARFVPARFDGRPVASRDTSYINFSLQR